MTLEGIALVFVTAVGACVGSFLNVVIYRLPAGRSIVHPPSHCPQCGQSLAWYDNVPVLAWFYLGGKCRRCRTPISFQYPAIEALTAAVFGGWFAVCYFTDLQPTMKAGGVAGTWPVLAVQLLLLAGLVAATVIDAKLYIIPLQIPWFNTAAAAGLTAAAGFGLAAAGAVELPAMSYFPAERLAAVGEPLNHAAAVRLAVERGASGTVFVAGQPWAIDGWAGVGIGGAAGVLASILLLRMGVLPQSFPEDPAAHDADTPAEDASPEAFLAHPHARREVLKECLFLVLPVVGAAIGSGLLNNTRGGLAPWLGALDGVLTGYLAGAGVVWATRIGGTLAFGKEAMGLGDVHLMGAIGAVAGWEVAVVAFFVAPFSGLAWALGSAGAAKLLKREVRIIPYGPHLAAASVLVMALREPLLYRLAVFTGLG